MGCVLLHIIKYVSYICWFYGIMLDGDEMIFKKFVINLDRRPDRMQEFYSRFGDDFDVERVSAVDGRVRGVQSNLSAVERGIINAAGYHDMVRYGGTFGCWMSHVNLWDRLVFSDADAFVIFEDDAFPCKDFGNKLNFVLDNVKPEMDIVYLGGRFIENFSPADLDKNWGKVGVFYEVTGASHGRYFDRTTHAYVLTKNGAEKILSLLAINKEKLAPLDGWLNHLKRNKLINALDIFPHLTHSPANYKTDIQVTKSTKT